MAGHEGEKMPPEENSRKETTDQHKEAETTSVASSEPADVVHISTDHLYALFTEAKEKYSVDPAMLDKLEDFNAYLIKNFRLAFGNRIMKQIGDFVPCFVACGGTEMEAVDFIVAKKVLRKFESLSLGFMKDELTKCSNYLDRLFGKNKMVVCKDYIEQLKKNN